MYKCDICGRKTNKKKSMQGYTLCSKHMHQLSKYGYFLDNIPRTNKDLNDYKILSNQIVRFNVYGQNNILSGHFLIDLEDIEKVKYHKWRFSHGHIVTGQPSFKNQRDLSHVVLGVTKKQIQEEGIVVDHINGDATDNRKNNLRICHQQQNVLNKNFMSNNTSGFIGVSYKKDRNVYDPEIRLNKTRCHLGQTRSLKEAVYKRYIAEQMLFQEHANKTEQTKKARFCANLPDTKRQELEQQVIKKLQSKNMLGN